MSKYIYRTVFIIELNFLFIIIKSENTMGKNIESLTDIWKIAGLRYKSHPWHGISIGDDTPATVAAFIECVPTDTVKYEIDKSTGYLKVDRPQKFSNVIPALYGFIPQTYSDELVAEYCRSKTGRNDIVGDHDPVDICVLTEKNITHGDILVQAVPIGGFRMIDGGEADDKIIAYLKNDQVYEGWEDVNDIPASIVERLKHYFLTYKTMPGQLASNCEITHTYGKDEAHELIRRSMKDYLNQFGKIENKLTIAAWESLNIGRSRQRKS